MNDPYCELKMKKKVWSFILKKKKNNPYFHVDRLIVMDCSNCELKMNKKDWCFIEKNDRNEYDGTRESTDCELKMKKKLCCFYFKKKIIIHIFTWTV